MIEEGRIMKMKHYIFKEATIERASCADSIDNIENAIIEHLDDSEITYFVVVEDIANGNT